MKLTLQAAMSAAATDALGRHGQGMFDDPSRTLLGVVELVHVERTEPAPNSDKERSVKLKVLHFEVPNKDQEGAVRETLRALHLQRTAQGTFDEVTGEIELAEQTVRQTSGLLHAIEVARYRAGVQHWADVAQQVLVGKPLSAPEMAHELDAIKTGLRRLLAGVDADTE